MGPWALLAFLYFSSYDGLVSRDMSKEPHITSQHTTKDGGMELWVHNPLDKAVWTWYECENIISLEPIGLPARRISEIHLKSNDADVPVKDNVCYITKWKVQDGKGEP